MPNSTTIHAKQSARKGFVASPSDMARLERYPERARVIPSDQDEWDLIDPSIMGLFNEQSKGTSLCR